MPFSAIFILTMPTSLNPIVLSLPTTPPFSPYLTPLGTLSQLLRTTSPMIFLISISLRNHIEELSKFTWGMALACPLIILVNLLLKLIRLSLISLICFMYLQLQKTLSLSLNFALTTPDSLNSTPHIYWLRTS